MARAAIEVNFLALSKRSSLYTSSRMNYTLRNYSSSAFHKGEEGVEAALFKGKTMGVSDVMKLFAGV